jgi:streptogramin lyase
LRTGVIAPIVAALVIAGCGGPSTGPSAAGAVIALEGDAALLASTQTISDAVGGCVRPPESTVESKVVSLESGTIVVLACSQGAYSYTHRLFAVRGGKAPELLSLPDYDSTGWFANDQASMAELDAGTGVLTTYRKGAEHGGCGSEGRFQWDGARFVLQELRWQDCSAPNLGDPPFPSIWPAPQGSPVDQNGATPAP